MVLIRSFLGKKRNVTYNIDSEIISDANSFAINFLVYQKDIHDFIPLNVIEKSAHFNANKIVMMLRIFSSQNLKTNVLGILLI